MSQFDLLQPQRQALQEQYSLLSQKLLELRRNAAFEANAAVRFQLEKQIEQAETDLADLDRRMDDLDRVSEDGRLYQALLKLGYRKQVNMFRKFVQHHPIASFLIYGKFEHGQRWLLNRLVVQHTRDSIAGKVITINLSRMSQRNDVSTLWRGLGRRVGLGAQSLPSTIVERVYQLWRTQNVLLIFYEVHFLPEDFLQELLQAFWSPLATQARQGEQPESAHKLLMFLVDYEGCVGDWSIPFAETLEATWHPRTPVKLPVIPQFTESELANWLEFSADDLPVHLIDDQAEMAQGIFEDSDRGIPEITLEEICRRSGLDWYENEEKWMKL